MGTIAQKAGLDVELILDGYERKINGAFIQSGNKILIDVYAGMNKIKGTDLDNLILPTLSHEMLHWMKDKAPELYRKYDAYVFKSLMLSTGWTERQILDKRLNLMQKAHPGVNYTDEQVRDEVIARASEDMLGKSEVIKGFVDTLSTNEKKTFIEKVKEILQNIKKWFEDYLAKNPSKAHESQLIKELPGRIDGQIKLFDAMLKSSIEANQAMKNEGIKAQKNTAEGDEQFAIREDFYAEFDKWVVDGRKDTNIRFVVGTTSDALKSIGMKDQEIILRSGTVNQKLATHKEMTTDIFKRIPELLEHPIIVQFSDAIDPKTQKPKYDSRISVLGELYADVVENGKTVKKPVLVSLELLPTNQKKSAILDFSIITSAYAKNTLQQYLNENSILYIEPNKKRTNDWLSLNRLQLPLGETKYGSIRMITYSGNKVKIQNSTKKTPMEIALEKAGLIDEFGNIQNSDRDSLDRELTEGQADYFKDSVVRDENGNLMVMYHGSPKTDISSFRLDLGGAYFTSNPEYAKEYGRNGKVYEVYLNITKPFDTRNAKDRAIFENEFYGKWGNGAPITEKGLPDWTDGDDLIEFLQEKGYDYDGLILDEGGVPTDNGVKDRGISYVIFDKANQAKYTDNLNPTTNENMQFSLREDVEETKELIAVHNMRISELEKSLDLGGLPMPSIAIIKAQSGHSEYDDARPLYNVAQDLEDELNRHKGEAGLIDYTGAFKVMGETDEPHIL